MGLSNGTAYASESPAAGTSATSAGKVVMPKRAAIAGSSSARAWPNATRFTLPSLNLTASDVSHAGAVLAPPEVSSTTVGVPALKRKVCMPRYVRALTRLPPAPGAPSAPCAYDTMAAASRAPL
jgi:hypothetical protein